MAAPHTDSIPTPGPAPTPQPYAIAVPAADLASLHTKLAHTRLPDELAAAGRAYGAPLPDVARLVAHWLHGYDWRAHEARINAALPQFTLDVPVPGFGALNIHFVHKRSAVRGAVPLLFVHGCTWPAPRVLTWLDLCAHRARERFGGREGPAAPDRPGIHGQSRVPCRRV